MTVRPQRHPLTAVITAIVLAACSGGGTSGGDEPGGSSSSSSGGSGSSSGGGSSSSSSSSGGGGTLTLTTTSCPAATQGQPYSCALAASGGTGAYTFSVVAPAVDDDTLGPLPEGMSLQASTGLVSSARVGGQGSYLVRVRVADAGGHSATRDLGFAVAGSNAYLSSIFPASSIFHHRVDGLPVDGSPAAPIPTGSRSAHLQVFFGGAAWQGKPNGIPAIDVPSDQPTVPVATTMYPSSINFTTGPIPPYAPVEGTAATSGDRHVLVYRRAGGGQPPALYEMWQGIYLGAAGWTDSSNAPWPDVTSNALPREDEGTSDAAGLPIAPLLLNADEVIGAGTPAAPSGVVQHPVRFTVQDTLNYWVWPGTACAGNTHVTCRSGTTAITQRTRLSQSAPPTSCTGTGVTSGPMGQIYRLKASVPAPACAATSPQAAIVITGFRNYGIILADNGGNGGLIGTPDARWNDDDLHCLTALTLADFEPVNVSTLMRSADSGETPTP
jgi:hypothetical protein